MQPNCYSLSFVALVIVSIVYLPLVPSKVMAQDDPRKSSANNETKTTSATSNTSNSSGPRTSPFDPPEENNEVFVTDDSPGLDTGCTYNTDPEHPLTIQISVDRAVGEVNDEGLLVNADQLIENGTIPTTLELVMPAFDVDFNGETPPERDEVLFNGKNVGLLNGADDVWRLNSFTVDIRDVKFPSVPGNSDDSIVPAENEVQINVDVLSTRSWCTAIDWAALTGLRAELPVLLLHGFTGQKEIWTQSTPFNWKSELNSLGIPSKAIQMGKVASIESNSRLVAQGVAGLKQQYGVNKINIVAHSKGGLDARRYITTNNDVENLIQLGSPNSGAVLANIATGIITSVGGVPASLTVLFRAKGLQDLTIGNMFIFNLLNRENINTEYVSLAGNHSPGGISGAKYIPGDDDTVVRVASVHGLSYADHKEYASSDDDEFSEHSGLYKFKPIFDQVKGSLESGSVSPSLQMLAVGNREGHESITSYPTAGSWTPVNEQLSSRATSSINLDLSTHGRGDALEQNAFKRTKTKAGTLMDGAINTHTVAIDQVDEADFTLLYGTGDLDVELVDPLGNRIDPTAAANASGIQYSTNENITGLKTEDYFIQDPTPGIWTVEVSGVNVPSPSGETYGVTAVLSGSPLDFSVHTDARFYSTEDPIEITATASEGGSPVTDANVTASILLPDQSTQDLTLVDDGTGGDPVADDGSYFGTFTNTAQSGKYAVVAQAERTTSPSFSREVTSAFTVATSRSQFNNTFEDIGEDTDNNGLFDQLRIDVGADIDVEGDYILTGDLVDSNGNLIQSVSETQTLSTGSKTISISFRGTTIFQNGTSGSYTLDNIVLAEVKSDGLLPTDLLDLAHTTSPYGVSDFQRPSIFLTGSSSDSGVDSDGDGQFDELRVEVEVNLRGADFYEWSAVLTDTSGTEIDFDNQSGTLSEGAATITFSFEGEKIGENGVGGPYVITDLLIFGRNGANLVASDIATTQPYESADFEGAPTDDTPPVCGPINLERNVGGELIAVNTSASDAESGIASVEFTRLENLSGSLNGTGDYVQGDVETFDASNTNSVDIRGERIDMNAGGEILTTVTNGVGLTAQCDPVVESITAEVPESFNLMGNYPNPFSQQTTIEFAVAEPVPVRLEVYDVLGRKVATLADEEMAPGTYKLTWDGHSESGQPLASGVYIYRIDAGPFSATRKLTLVR